MATETATRACDTECAPWPLDSHAPARRLEAMAVAKELAEARELFDPRNADGVARDAHGFIITQEEWHGVRQAFTALRAVERAARRLAERVYPADIWVSRPDTFTAETDEGTRLVGTLWHALESLPDGLGSSNTSGEG